MFSLILTAFTLSLATPVLAAQHPTTSENPQAHASEPHKRISRYGNAHAHAVPGGTSAREQSIRECSTEEQKYTQPTWGEAEYFAYRACMARHGQNE